MIRWLSLAGATEEPQKRLRNYEKGVWILAGKETFSAGWDKNLYLALISL